MYKGLAKFYNKYMEDLDYKSLAQFSRKMFERSDFFIKEVKPIVLDLACGTGSLTLELYEFGYDLIGLDISPEMLEIAREEEEKKFGKNEILWLRQDMMELDLYGTVAGMVCATDGINHIIDNRDMKKFFKNIYNYLEYTGIFVFDLLTEKYFKEIIGSNTFCHLEDDSTCIWESRYNEKKKEIHYDISTFERLESGDKLYRRYDDVVIERAWDLEELEKYIKKAKLEIIDIFSSFNEDPITAKDLRRYFVLQKKK